MLERRVPLVAESIELAEELEFAAQVLEDDEGELAVHAAGDDAAAGDAAHVGGVLPRLERLVGGLERPDLVARLVPGGIRDARLTPGGEPVTPLGEDVAVLSVLLVHGWRQAFSMSRTLNFFEPWGTATVTLSPGL